MTNAYKERHDYLIKALQAIPGIKCLPSDGTFYSFPSIVGLYNEEKGVMNDLAFAEYLLKEAEIAVVPGSAFGTPGHIRISYATSMANLRAAVERLTRAAAELMYTT